MDNNNKLKFFIGVIACFAIVFLVGLGFSGERNSNKNEVSESLVTEQPKVKVPKLYNTAEKPSETAEPVVEEPEAKPEEEPAEDVFVPSKPEKYTAPVSGDVTKDYSEKPVYSKTLDDWRAHTGVDFKASEGEEVKAAAAGVVEDVYYDSLYGYTAVIGHTGGTQTVYSNLEGDVTVAPGQTVSEGELIGYAGSTAAAEASEDGHVHFSMKRDGKYINPNDELSK